MRFGRSGTATHSLTCPGRLGRTEALPKENRKQCQFSGSDEEEEKEKNKQSLPINSGTKSSSSDASLAITTFVDCSSNHHQLRTCSAPDGQFVLYREFNDPGMVIGNFPRGISSF